MAISLEEFKLRSVIPTEYVDAIEAVHPGFVEAQISMWLRWVYARLTKRYETSKWVTEPEVVRAWVCRIVTNKVYLRRGVDPTDAQYSEIIKDHDNAMNEVKEAADSASNNFDLPMVDDAIGSGITYGGPRVYSEASPYAWQDVQVDAARGEDRNRRGSS